jgi:hypothetical protein
MTRSTVSSQLRLTLLQACFIICAIGATSALSETEEQSQFLLNGRGKEDTGSTVSTYLLRLPGQTVTKVFSEKSRNHVLLLNPASSKSTEVAVAFNQSQIVVRDLEGDSTYTVTTELPFQIDTPADLDEWLSDVPELQMPIGVHETVDEFAPEIERFGLPYGEAYRDFARTESTRLHAGLGPGEGHGACMLDLRLHETDAARFLQEMISLKQRIAVGRVVVSSQQKFVELPKTVRAVIGFWYQRPLYEGGLESPATLPWAKKKWIKAWRKQHREHDWRSKTGGEFPAVFLSKPHRSGEAWKIGVHHGRFNPERDSEVARRFEFPHPDSAYPSSTVLYYYCILDSETQEEGSFIRPFGSETAMLTKFSEGPAVVQGVRSVSWGDTVLNLPGIGTFSSTDRRGWNREVEPPYQKFAGFSPIDIGIRGKGEDGISGEYKVQALLEEIWLSEGGDSFRNRARSHLLNELNSLQHGPMWRLTEWTSKSSLLLSNESSGVDAEIDLRHGSWRLQPSRQSHVRMRDIAARVQSVQDSLTSRKPGETNCSKIRMATGAVILRCDDIISTSMTGDQSGTRRMKRFYVLVTVRGVSDPFASADYSVSVTAWKELAAWKAAEIETQVIQTVGNLGKDYVINGIEKAQERVLRESKPGEVIARSEVLGEPPGDPYFDWLDTALMSSAPDAEGAILITEDGQSWFIDGLEDQQQYAGMIGSKAVFTSIACEAGNCLMMFDLITGERQHVKYAPSRIELLAADDRYLLFQDAAKVLWAWDYRKPEDGLAEVWVGESNSGISFLPSAN